VLLDDSDSNLPACDFPLRFGGHPLPVSGNFYHVRTKYEAGPLVTGPPTLRIGQFDKFTVTFSAVAVILELLEIPSSPMNI
jgi:hypothetical protein